MERMIFSTSSLNQQALRHFFHFLQFTEVTKVHLWKSSKQSTEKTIAQYKYRLYLIYTLNWFCHVTFYHS